MGGGDAEGRGDVEEGEGMVDFGAEEEGEIFRCYAVCTRRGDGGHVGSGWRE